MTFICKANGVEHRHELADEGRVCYGFGPRPAPTVPVAGPVRPYTHTESATAAQVRYVGILGGDSTRAAAMSKTACSTYIEELKKGRPVEEATPLPREKVSKVPIELLKMIRPGRYAVRLDSLHPYVFLRVGISTARNSRYKDAIKVQTQHGPTLSQPKMVVWPSGKVSLYDYTVEEPLLLLITDQQGAARAYAKELGRCARCGLELTDEQSRKWGVGPECIQHWPWMRTLAEEEDSS